MKKQRRTRRHHCPSSDAARIWREIEEQLVPALRPWPAERLAYFYLVRRTRLEGRRTVVISAAQLGRAVLLSCAGARLAVRRLAARGAVRIAARSREGFSIEVRLPREIPGCARVQMRFEQMELERADFYSNQRMRTAIYRREKAQCFYCRRRVHFGNRLLDHVTPRVRGGGNSYRNVVACCLECNSSKGEMTGSEFLRVLLRRGMLTRREYEQRVATTEAVKNGKLKPMVETHSRRAA